MNLLSTPKNTSKDMKNNSPHKGRNKVRKHGISALQFLKIECSDTQLARGFHPLDPEHQK